MLASSQGGMSIEDVAKENPDAIMAEPVDIEQGLQPGQAEKVAAFMGFEGEQKDQVLGIVITYALENLLA